jgi:hypothetical protein
MPISVSLEVGLREENMRWGLLIVAVLCLGASVYVGRPALTPVSLIEAITFEPWSTAKQAQDRLVYERGSLAVCTQSGSACSTSERDAAASDQLRATLRTGLNVVGWICLLIVALSPVRKRQVVTAPPNSNTQ